MSADSLERAADIATIIGLIGAAYSVYKLFVSKFRTVVHGWVETPSRRYRFLSRSFTWTLQPESEIKLSFSVPVERVGTVGESAAHHGFGHRDGVLVIPGGHPFDLNRPQDIELGFEREPGERPCEPTWNGNPKVTLVTHEKWTRQLRRAMWSSGVAASVFAVLGVLTVFGAVAEPDLTVGLTLLVTAFVAALPGLSCSRSQDRW